MQMCQVQFFSPGFAKRKEHIALSTEAFLIYFQQDSRLHFQIGRSRSIKIRFFTVASVYRHLRVDFGFRKQLLTPERPLNASGLTRSEGPELWLPFCFLKSPLSSLNNIQTALHEHRLRLLFPPKHTDVQHLIHKSE